jgi:hypothetical protein
MMTMRRSLLLFSLAGCWAMVAPPLRVAAEEQDDAIFSPIAALRVQEKVLPVEALKPPPEAEPKRAPEVRCEYLITVADDFVVEVYHNGKPVPDTQRELLVERFGATAEKVQVAVRTGDWLVFHVVQNRLRWGGSKYFAVAGCFAANEFGFVSDHASADWSVCDDPAKAPAFIQHRDKGRNTRAVSIEVPWGEGDQYMKECAGKDFGGKALWGRSPSTWIKFVAGQPGTVVDLKDDRLEPIDPSSRPPPEPGPVEPKPFLPRKWPVQILSAIYGTGGKDADVTAKVTEHVETFHRPFSANPPGLGADPNPYWNKSLHIIYMKDGVRREQRRNENETVLPESFYGPQDAGELRSWLPASRWFGEQPEIQFHADQTFTSPGVPGTPRWEATGPNKLRLTWSDERTVDYVFDYTWSSFSEVGNGRNVFHLRK